MQTSRPPPIPSPSSVELTIRDPPPVTPNPPVATPIACEKRIDRMFWLTLTPAIRSKYQLVRWGVPALVNVVLAPATFCMLYYPSYYPTQGIVWSTDIAIIWVTYNFLLYLQHGWDKASCFEHKEVRPWVHRVSYAFYWLYLAYWFYFAVIQFTTHSAPSILIQLGNTLMSTAWFIFFSVTAVVYYYICIKLSQRTESVQEWIYDLKPGSWTLSQFYLMYNAHSRRAEVFSKNWNFVIFLGIVLLTFHVPIDLVSIMYNKYYYDIFGLIIKAFSLLWYLMRICELNDIEGVLVSRLYKYRIFSQEEIKEIETYMTYRQLGLDFYGIRINKAAIIKVLLVVANLLVPTLYALASNEYFAGSRGGVVGRNVTSALSG